ncbi:isopenicillin N synthase family dioxygenase [Nocardia fluminea]|uniref:isopenicillin N synthase family dioxygenase n=1 Tax=Nocardia fluminea TaxID=134984 RepID=UPI0037BDCA06
MTRTTSFTSVPVVDISGLGSGDPAAEQAVAEQLGVVCREIGFFYVTGTGLDDTVFADLLAATKTFFALSTEEKMRYYIGRSTCHRGYVPIGEEGDAGAVPDLKEAFDTALDLPADDPDHLAGNPMLGPNVWPDIPGFAARVTAYYDAVTEIGQRLLRAFAIALGEDPDTFTRYTTKTTTQLRLIHYWHDSSAQDRPGFGAHTDMECFTLLKPTAPGLEVLNGAGEWIDVPPIENALVVNIGDLLEMWTNGEFVATSHRVRKVADERYSFPLFFSVDYDTVVAPLPRFCADGAKRPTVVAGEHIFGQTANYFEYLRARMARGELILPDSVLPESSFGQQALQRAI